MRRATAFAVPIRRLSGSISSHFVAIHLQSKKNTKTLFCKFNTTKMLVTSTCYNKQHVFAYLHVRRANIGKISIFYKSTFL